MSLPSKILLTGATGFLGRHVLRSLKELYPEARVIALVRNKNEWSTYDWTKEYKNISLVEGNVAEKSWQESPELNGLTGIIHLAAVVKHSRDNVDDMRKANIEGTLNCVDLAAKQKCRMLFLSSSGTVGCFKKSDHKAFEDAPYADKTVGKWPYYESKIQAEKLAFERAAQCGVSLTVVRPPVLLGPEDHKFRSTGHVIKHLKKQFPFILSGGMNFADVRDVANAIVRALWHPSARPIYHLSGTATSLETFFNMCESVSGIPAPKKILSPRVALTLASTASRVAKKLNTKSPLPDPVIIEMAGHHWGLDSYYAEHELGYTSRSPYQTLADTVAWIRAHQS